MNTEYDVLISGAGIAGPALAYWLRRAGYRPTVVERAPAPRPGGQAVDLRGAGRTVVERMGLMEQAREVSLDQKGFALVDARGSITARVPEDAFGGKGIVSEIEILRGDLCRLLYEASLPDTEYLFDETITGIEQDSDGVSVSFARARSRRFSLVVGADGMHSTVRRLAFGPDSACLRPLNLYNSWFSAPPDIDLGGWFVMFNAPGGLVAGARPGREDDIKASLAFRSEPLEAEPLTPTAQRELLAQRFAGAGWEVPRLLDAMWSAPDFFFEPVAQVHLDRWWRGRVTLLGDAACCPTSLSGMGTSLAIVGAYVLAAELATAGGDHKAALPRYQERMSAYVKQAQRLPGMGVAGFAPSSALSIRIRATSMSWMTRWPMRSLVAGQFTKADAIELPSWEPAALSVEKGPNEPVDGCRDVDQVPFPRMGAA
ncbi:MAG: FAD-dependent monooxygenase [Candidatus Dormibacteraeota bacterium]|nr:FAD-dependent monooxygenase [Candidatus Dormibacteraeota bacterium]